jgi:hypothetical protein
MGMFEKKEADKENAGQKGNTSFLEDNAQSSFNGLESRDFEVPYLRILQSLNNQCIPATEEYIEGAQAGMFYNTLTSELYGNEIEVIPVKFKKTWIEWEPNRGGFVAEHVPGSVFVDKSNFSKWVRPNGNNVVEYYNFFCLIPDRIDEGLIIFSLSSSAIKHAKKWNSKIAYSKLPSGNRAPFYASVWKLKTEMNKNEKGTWFTLGTQGGTSITQQRFITEEEYNQHVQPSLLSLEEPKEQPKQLEQEENTIAKPLSADY